jgi:hypothetical protein
VVIIALLVLMVILAVLCGSLMLGEMAGAAAERRRIDGELKDGQCTIGGCTYLVKAVVFTPADEQHLVGVMVDERDQT